MGFLTGTFMKSFALRMKLQAQRRQMNITMQTTQIQRQMRNLQTKQKNQQNFQNSIYQQEYQSQYNTMMAQCERDANGQLTEAGRQTYQNLQGSLFNIQNQFAMNKQMNSQMWDSWFEMQLEPLKDMEEKLQMEKQQADQDLAFWTETEKAYADQAKNDMKSLMPESQG